MKSSSSLVHLDMSDVTSDRSSPFSNFLDDTAGERVYHRLTALCCSKRFKCVAALNRGLSTSLELTEHRPAMSWSTHWLRLPNDTWPWSVSLRRVTELSSDSCTHVHPQLEMLLALRALLLLPSVCDEQNTLPVTVTILMAQFFYEADINPPKHLKVLSGPRVTHVGY